MSYPSSRPLPLPCSTRLIIFKGSTYIYRTHLAPLFSEHERDIDSFLASLRGRATTALAGGIGWLWEKIRAQLNVRLFPDIPRDQCLTVYRSLFQKPVDKDRIKEDILLSIRVTSILLVLNNRQVCKIRPQDRLNSYMVC